ncbi:MAG: transmembrane prediction [Acidobacteria bacterium]|nr:MAG: transmembrane prediction [Acidobacteriota bacterium]
MRRIVLIFIIAFVAGLAAVFGASSWEPVKLAQVGSTVEVTVGGKPFTTYYFESDVAKPYFQPLRTAQGTVITRAYPVGNTFPAEHAKDSDAEPHQRPMYFGHGNIDGIDFWGEAAFAKFSDGTAFGRTVFRKIEALESGPASGTLRATFDLVSPNGRAIAGEVQSFVIQGNATTRIVDCEITILANHGSDVTMGDTKEGTFALRLAPELNSPPGHMTNSSGAEGEKAIWGKRADWVDYDGVIGGEPLGVAIFDSPKSFRHPTTWHARGYGLFAANPFGLREFTRDPKQDGSWTIEQHKSLTLRYRVFIHHGDYREAHVAEAYREFAAGER